MTKLTPEAVSDLRTYCFFKDDENKDDAILVEGIVAKYGFHPGRIAEKKEEIRELLLELPETFQKEKGGGWSFLNACVDKNQHQWTGEHRTMEMLFCLGMAAGLAEYCMPREMWGILPGGVPYIMLTLE